MKLYAYCVAEGLSALDDTPRGISDAEVRLLNIGDLVVLVSDYGIDAVPVTRENALSHAAVVRSVLAQSTPLPFRFGTLVTEQQLRSYVTAREPVLKKALAHVSGCVEMSVKIIWDVSNKQSAGPTEPTQAEEAGVGTNFLAAKRRQILGDERKAAEAVELSKWLDAVVTGLTRDEMVTLRPSEKLALAAAHLVERSKIEQYRGNLAAARENRPELRFLVSGPWPPYSFANIELEFKSLFGVS